MKLDVYSYEFPFTQFFATAAGTFRRRKGLYLRFKKNGITAWGEAAPLAGFSKETLSDVIHQLKNKRIKIKELLDGSFSSEKVQHYLNSAQLYPSLEIAIYTLAATWMAQKRGQSLHDYLFDAPPNAIPINAVLGLEELDPIQTVDKQVEHGFETVKIKTDHQTGKLVTSLQQIHEKYPKLSIRIDANQSWSPEEAADCLKRIENYSIEYCEEPLARPNSRIIRELENGTAVPIALDESLAGTFSLHEAARLVPVLIIKPTIVGIMPLLKDIPDLTTSRPVKLIFTTTLESSIGRLMTATLAAGLGSSDFAHGLGTGHLLENDMWSDEVLVDRGNFHLPNNRQLAELMNRSITKLPVKKIL